MSGIIHSFIHPNTCLYLLFCLCSNTSPTVIGYWIFLNLLDLHLQHVSMHMFLNEDCAYLNHYCTGDKRAYGLIHSSSCRTSLVAILLILFVITISTVPSACVCFAACLSFCVHKFQEARFIITHNADQYVRVNWNIVSFACKYIHLADTVTK